MASARKPIASDSPSAMTPRITGKRSTQWRVIGETIGFETCAISPSGLRTATAQFEAPRIITPSSTAWPPIGAAIATQTDARAKPARPDDGTASSASGTACPPIGALTTSDGGLGGLRPLEAALEPLHPATRVD